MPVSPNHFPYITKSMNLTEFPSMMGVIDEVTCDVSAVKISTVAPQYAHASLGSCF